MGKIQELAGFHRRKQIFLPEQIVLLNYCSIFEQHIFGDVSKHIYFIVLFSHKIVCIINRMNSELDQMVFRNNINSFYIIFQDVAHSKGNHTVLDITNS